MPSTSPQYRTATQAITSRRAKVEQKKLLRQTVFFFGLAIVIGLALIGVVVPGLIRLIGGLGGGNVVATQDLPPLLAPVISAPVPATFSASIKLSGFAEKGSTVVLVQNGQESTNTTAQDNGAFQLDVQLQKGENTLATYAKTSADRQSAVSQEFKVIMDDELPILEITDPKDGEKKSIEGKKNQSTTIVGKTDPGSKVTLNDRITFVQADGSFSGSYFLQNGDNEIKVKAMDQAGNITEKSVTISFHE